MSFLFKSKKNAPAQGASNTALPSATRNVHTSDGTTGTTSTLAEKHMERKTQSPPPNTTANDALSSLVNQSAGPATNPGNISSPSTAPLAALAQRQRAGSELGARPQTATRQPSHADLYPWSQKPLSFSNLNANPFPRYGPAVNAVASKDGDVYLMGGLVNGDVVRGDLWIVESGATPMSCYPIATVSEGPGPRVGHASLLVGNAFIVFGGDTKMADADLLDDTLYLLNTTSRQWSRATPPGPRPSGRYGHTLNIVGSKIYIFGGQVEGSFYNDLIAFDLNALQNPANQWEFLVHDTKGQKANAVPAPRTNHTMISHNDCLYLFGGTDGTTWYNDVWMFEPKTNKWTQQDCIGYIPAPREGHSAALVNDVMYVFGGRTELGEDLGDLAAFRISLRRWYTFQNMGPAPSARSGHSMTAFGKQIIVLAGEPSTAPRDPAELSMAYVLDTAKIKYPNDGMPVQKVPAALPPLTERTNDLSRAPNNQANPPRSTSRQGATSRNDEPPQIGPTEHPGQRPELQARSLPRASIGPVPPSTPPDDPTIQEQPTQPFKANNIPTPAFDQKGKPSPAASDAVARHFGETQLPRQSSIEATTPNRPAQIRADSRDSRIGREGSPGSQGRRTPGNGSISKARNMEAGEAAPLVGASVARQRSIRSQRGQSFEGSEDGSTMRSAAARAQLDHNRHSKSFAEEPLDNTAPRNDALLRELEMLKGKNAWYASELALARKSGYATASSPTLDERSTLTFADDDRPLIEAFMTMRNELVKMQQNMEQQASATARKIAEVEHQRDVAVTEAAYARAKLVAHGGSARSTPQLDSVRDPDDAEHNTNMSRRLALSLAAVNEHKVRLESMQQELDTERRAREAAEEAAEAAQARFDDLTANRNPHELEALRTELHNMQGFARAESGQKTELEQKLRMLEVEHKALNEKHRDISDQMSSHLSSLAPLEAAVAASTSKSAMYERQLQEEREERQVLQRQLAELRMEHEDRSRQMDSMTRQLRDAQQLADTHAQEASTHRGALMTAFASSKRLDPSTRDIQVTDEKVSVLQQALEQANSLAKANADAAEAALQKLRGAEERIAGLEAYQEQSSREGVNVRRQLQTAIRDMRQHETEKRELRQKLETHQRDASALTVQHGALKDLLSERGIDSSGVRRSPIDVTRSLSATPDLGRIRELEQQLHAAQKAHDDTRSTFEVQQQDAEKAYRERLEQLETDYQSLITYVRGTEKMLKKMKEELQKYKSQNQRLSSELEASRDGKRSVGSTSTDPAEWAEQREAMQIAINDLRSQMSNQIESLETNMLQVQKDLHQAQTERDEQKASHEQLATSLSKRERELSELKNENSMLETRALDAEHRVTMLLDQVGSSVSQYRRQSTRMSQHGSNGVMHVAGNTANHNRVMSHASTAASDISSEHEERDDARGSVALDNLASELETLKAQWESQSRAYRLSSKFDFERPPSKFDAERSPTTGDSELADSLKQWRNEARNSGSVVGQTAEHGKNLSTVNSPKLGGVTSSSPAPVVAPATIAAKAAATMTRAATSSPSPPTTITTPAAATAAVKAPSMSTAAATAPSASTTH